MPDNQFLSPTQLSLTITHLEMRAKPPRRELKPPRENVEILHAAQPTVSFYRYLYNTVGEPWLWYERRALSDEDLRAEIQHPQVEIYVLYVAGVPAGYAELDLRQEPDVELKYFGLIPEFIGQGLGTYLLHWIIDKAWTLQPKRFWLHTCTLDHPQALSIYQRAGFVTCMQEEKIIDVEQVKADLRRNNFRILNFQPG